MKNFVGRLVRTIGGELDTDDGGHERITPPRAIGFLADENQPGQWAVHFGDAAVFVEDGELADRLQYQVITRTDEMGLSPDQEAEVLRRSQILNDLLRSAGPAYTFWKHAVDASREAGGFAGVDWSAVHLATILESVCDLAQPAESVSEALCKYSPGAVLDVQIAAIGAQVDAAENGLALKSVAPSAPSLE